MRRRANSPGEPSPRTTRMKAARGVPNDRAASSGIRRRIVRIGTLAVRSEATRVVPISGDFRVKSGQCQSGVWLISEFRQSDENWPEGRFLRSGVGDFSGRGSCVAGRACHVGKPTMPTTAWPESAGVAARRARLVESVPALVELDEEGSAMGTRYCSIAPFAAIVNAYPGSSPLPGVVAFCRSRTSFARTFRVTAPVGFWSHEF